MSFAIFDESFYLANNPDVSAAVNAGIFSSGLQHFQLAGLAEGRVLVSPYYNEDFYLRKYPDVAAAVATGSFSSGLQQFILLGEAEGRDGTPFSEQFYLQAYPDVAAAVDAGVFSSGLQHYLQAGQQEGRFGILLGTSGNDIITSFGLGNQAITGVTFNALSNPGGGVGEVDILIGAEGTDLFNLGIPSFPPFTSSTQQFYVGGGNTDYALIQNFQQLSDVILLAGLPENYSLQPANGNLNIFTTGGDLVGIVEGVTSVSPIPGDDTGSFFILV